MFVIVLNPWVLTSINVISRQSAEFASSDQFSGPKATGVDLPKILGKTKILGKEKGVNNDTIKGVSQLLGGHVPALPQSLCQCQQRGVSLYKTSIQAVIGLN